MGVITYPPTRIIPARSASPFPAGVIPRRVSFGLPAPRLLHQYETFTSQAKATLQSGAYGSGKTLTNAWITLRLALEYPGNLILMGAETSDQLKQTLQADFDTLISDLTGLGLVKYHGGDRVYTFWNGSLVLPRPLVGNNAQAMRHRLRSLNLGAAVIEEITSIPEATTLEILGRLRRPGTSRQLYASCNPDTPEHYLYQMFVTKRRPGFRLIKSNTYDNPFLPLDYIRTLEGALGPEMAQRYLRGEWVNYEGRVFKEFRRATDDGQPWHVLPAASLANVPWVTRWGGLDFGGANPHAYIKLAEDSAGYWYVTGEWYKAQVGLQEVAAAILADPVSPIYRDHDQADALTLQAMGVTGMLPAKKEKLPGLATLMYLLKPPAPGLPPRLRISDQAENLIREIGAYKWPEGKATRDPANEPVKKDDHALDALRYSVHSRYAGQGGAVLQG